jgi:hypothetical protein
MTSFTDWNYRAILTQNIRRRLIEEVERQTAVGKIAEAKRLCEEAKRAIPTDPVPCAELGRLHLEQGELGPAFAELSTARRFASECTDMPDDGMQVIRRITRLLEQCVSKMSEGHATHSGTC